MKLYATTTSERASKSQGGNRFVELRATVGGKDHPKRVLYARIDARDEGYYLIMDVYGDDGDVRSEHFFKA